MPWHVEQGGGTCAADEYAVIKDADGSTAGCHATAAEAEAQRRALYANESEASVMWTIHQTDRGWEARHGSETLATCSTYEEALARIAAAIQAESAPTSNGVLTERWVGDPAICFSDATGDGRDFSHCAWSARNPKESLIPLMLQTETAPAHFEAKLAGFVEEFENLGEGTNPNARGRFYDNEVGRQARDLLLDGRRFGVSVDPGSVVAEMDCLTEDADGWCQEALINFSAYEIIGVTMTPFPGFARAAVMLEQYATPTAAEAEAPESVAAAATDRLR